ncbi:membrane-flanked domain-containing protein [Rhodococcus gordoniae]|uniref:Membrane-flanked domain-containing protein n=1 Tax=Rhodococcus gordoniae TaxID=223392 RepID=A0A379M6B5_9NOCA|nr:PH domain-containing protein [Rhodococcus gordoniae]SUE17173.1 membrane-flanked domain-containing protein [Rhodococcus gordoniae]
MNDTAVPAAETDEQVPWSRLDRRMLLIHPIEEILRLLPVLAGSFVIGTTSGNPGWGLAATGVLVLIGLSRWFTTTYRVGPVHVELRRGLLQRRELSIPRSRIRSVDVEQRLMHRVLGLAVLKIGTGQGGGADHNRFELDGLPIAAVPELRAVLLTGGERVAEPSEPAPTSAAPTERQLARFDPGWVRYAPFSTTGLLAVAAITGAAFQFGLGRWIAESQVVRRAVEAAEDLGLLVALVILVLVVVLVASPAACVRYLMVYGDLRVTDDDRVLRIAHGLLTTRHTTLDRARLRGVALHEPLALRLVGAARLDAVMTGRTAQQGGSSLVLPPAPDGEVRRVAAEVLTERLPLDAPLRSHGPRARRRRYTRTLWPVGVVVVAGLVALTVTGRHVPLPAIVTVIVLLVAGACALAQDRYRGLGHTVVDGHLVARSGSIDRQRICLDAKGVIGWTVRQTFFQRRAGLATVVAATPAGAGRYEVIDIPMDEAWALVQEVTPGMGEAWMKT